MILIFDTETTGFPSKDIPSNHPKQAHICQIAWLLLDEHSREVSSFKSLVKPDNWTISSGAQGAHGISQQDCEKHGIPVKGIMDLFRHYVDIATVVVAHNIKFDKHLIEIDSNIDGAYPWKRQVCTMELMTPICKLPSQRQTYKWPKLQEAYQYCFKEEFKGAHDALADVRATARIVRWLIDNRHLSL